MVTVTIKRKVTLSELKGIIEIMECQQSCDRIKDATISFYTNNNVHLDAEFDFDGDVTIL